MCLEVFCLSNLLSSVRAEVIAASMSCDARGRHEGKCYFVHTEAPQMGMEGIAELHYLRAVLHLGYDLGVQWPVVAEALGAPG